MQISFEILTLGRNVMSKHGRIDARIHTKLFHPDCPHRKVVSNVIVKRSPWVSHTTRCEHLVEQRAFARGGKRRTGGLGSLGAGGGARGVEFGQLNQQPSRIDQVYLNNVALAALSVSP